VGAAVGAAAGALAMAAAHLSPALGIAVAFALSIVLTGAVHLDGFADGCDAFFAPVAPERRREILKDPRHGTFALAGVAVLVVLWIAALASIEPRAYPVVLAVAAAAARWGAVARMPGTLRIVIFVELIAIFALSLLAPSPRGAVIEAAAGFVAAALVLIWARERIAGASSGDAYGFAIAIAEVAALIAYAAA
ncbi:MAG TPA: adenosylcobinamide-GDP ribazoletransferase, partial [Candidatus Elarobacter sp.]